ncbi:MAG: protein kinase, partial [Thermoanaerobaculia bacterium]|nr:protein kinase [Thermoanaerobaculia bacterium]
GFASSPQFLERFEREARAISSLNHPNICTLHDVGHEDGSHYLVMELIEGESLADRLKKGPLGLHEVLMYGRQIAAALDAAHRKGVVHRDLKPGNIMLTRSGAKLLDFGLAKTAAEGQAPIDGLTSMATEAKPLTQEGTILGTFQYMAPEQLDGIEADARTDIFALGAVLYEMATGKRAFSGETKSSLIASIVSSQPEPISQVTPMTPPALDHVVRRCLEKDPDDRWQSAHDIASELQWISEAGSQAGVAAPVTMRRKTRERLAWTLAGLLFVFALILGFLQLQPEEAPSLVMSHILPPNGSGFNLTGVNVTGFAISPDGKKIAMVSADTNGDDHLYIRFLDNMEARKLSGTRGATNPFWSPDSRFVAFFADGKLKKVDISGAPPLTLASATTGRPGSWNEDGVILFSPTTIDPIYRVADTGGELAQATTLDKETGETTHRWAHFLPDGNHFIYMASSHNVGLDDEVSAIWIGSLEDPDKRQLLLRARSNVAYAEGYLLYERDDVLVAQAFDPDALELSGGSIPIAEGVAYASDFFGGAFSVSPAGVLLYGVGSTQTDVQTTWLDRSGNEIAAVGPPADADPPRLSPDGRRAVMELDDDANGTSDLWLIDLDRNLRTRFTFEKGREGNPRWSPDGSQIVYWSQEVGSPGGAVKTKSASGSADPEIVYESEERGFGPADWHPDGTLLLGTTGPAGPDMMTMRIGEGEEPEPLFTQEFAEVNAYFSPDRKWLVYVTNESGEFENYVTSYPDLRGKWQLSREGSRCCGHAWRGNEVYFKGPNGQFISVRVEPVNGSLNISMPEVLFVNPRIDSFDVSPDGQRILANIAPEIDEEPLTMISNWTAMIESDR